MYLKAQRVASDTLAFNPEDGDLHYSMILSLVKQKNHYLANLQFQVAAKYLSKDQYHELKQLLSHG